MLAEHLPRKEKSWGLGQSGGGVTRRQRVACTCTQLLLHATTHSLVSKHMPTGAPLSSIVVAVRSPFLMQ